MNKNLQKKIMDILHNPAISDEEAEKQIQAIMSEFGIDEEEFIDTPTTNAYNLLEKAENAKTKVQAIKLAKEAYKTSNECFDAILFQVDLEDDSVQRLSLLNEGLEIEKKRLEKEEYFTKDNIGSFYGMLETRPYIRGLYTKAHLLLEDGKIRLAKDVCEEIIILNNNDNTGARYLLMAIYAYLEEEKELLKLYKKYPEENLEILYPLFSLYYKLEDNKKAKEYLDRINKANPNFIKYFKGTIKEDNAPYGYYSIGSPSEVFMYMDSYMFLVDSTPNIGNFIISNSKKKK